MTRNVQLVLVCEDHEHEVFARHFLRKAGWSTRRLRVERAPAGRGSAEQFVRKRFPTELSAYRSTRNLVDQRLVVFLDGDREGLLKRLQQLDQFCRSSDTKPRQNDEKVAIFVPTWCIETWFAYLDGTDVDEGKKDYPRVGRARECREYADKLLGMCKQGNLRQPAPPSLEAACVEYHTRLQR